MRQVSLLFTAPYKVAVEEYSIRPPITGEALVQTLASGISSGTELLLYRGQMPADLSVDESIPSLNGSFQYPLKYGYAAVGRVIELGPGTSSLRPGDLVFSFHPHESPFVCPTTELIKVPSGISAEDATFLPNMETAVNLVMDGQPSIGEQVTIFGQGVVGLLVTALVSRMPVASLVTIDRFSRRREVSLELGATASLGPEELSDIDTALQEDREYAGADLCYELSGNPEALDAAIRTTGYNGRLVIGSWYGTKRSDLDLGGRFHRSRIQLISSQVSTIGPEWSGRWTKARRLDFAWEMIRKVRPSRLISHTFDLDEAERAYVLLDREPATTLQVLLTYET